MASDPSTYKTGNAVPSNQPQDVSDNARVFDAFTNDQANEQVVTRTGVTIDTLHGVQVKTDNIVKTASEQIDLAIAAAGRKSIGAYDANPAPEFTTLNQYVTASDGREFSVINQSDLSYTVQAGLYPDPDDDPKLKQTGEVTKEFLFSVAPMPWIPSAISGVNSTKNQPYEYIDAEGNRVTAKDPIGGNAMGSAPLPSLGFVPVGNGNFFTWADLNVKTDGTDQLSEVQAAINLSATMGLKISDVNPVSVSGTVVFPDSLVFDEMRLVAIGNGWTQPAGVPSTNTDDVGAPLVHATGNNIQYRYLGLDGGLTTIDTVNQNVAASGICWNSTGEAEAVTGTTHVHHYNRYGFWVRGKHTDSNHGAIITNQWAWSEKGWTDISARTAAGFINSSGDFSVSSIMSWYNSSNIKWGSTCFTTHYAFIHPYNGSDTPADNINIENLIGAVNQLVTTCYLDNGNITSYDTASLNIEKLTVVRNSNSITSTAIKFVADSSQIDLVECQIGSVRLTVNELYSKSGSSGFVGSPVIRSVHRVGVQNQPAIATPHEEHSVVQTHNARKTYVINGDGGSDVVDQTVGLFAVRESRFGALYSGVTIAGLGRTAIAANPTSDMSVLPTQGSVVCEHGMFGSNGVDFGTALNPNTPSVRLQLVAAEDWDMATAKLGTRFVARTTTIGGTTASPALVTDSQHIGPGTDGLASAGKAGFRYSELWSVNGTINTSDETKKYFDPTYDDTFFEGIPNAVLDAWGEVPIVRFKWLSEIENFEAGKRKNPPRWHVGRKAQEVQRAFARHGVDATEYGVFCYDKWEETVIDHPAEYGEGELVPTGKKIEVTLDDGTKEMKDEYAPEKVAIREAWTEVLPAGEVYSIRDNEAANIEAAYQRRRMARIEAKLGL